jgi:hypothetical protein
MKKLWLISDYSQAEIRVAAWAGPIPLMKQWFNNGEDIHINVAKLIGQEVERSKIKLPNNLWGRKPWQDLTNDDPVDHDNERDLAKRTVHANTNGMFRTRFARITGLPIHVAGRVQDIYHNLFPEIRNGYHKWIHDCVKTTGTLINPLGWKRTFYKVNPLSGDYDEDELRVMYAWYPQSTIGMLTIRTLSRACEVLRSNTAQPGILSPKAIRAMGYDVQLQVHDMIGMVVSDDIGLIRDTALLIKELGEQPMIIKGEALVIPMDFKIGPSWGELKKLEV